MEKLKIEKKLNTSDDATIQSLDTVAKLLQGVGDASWRACWATTGSNILYFWANRGYTKLTSGKTTTQIIDQLYIDMKSNIQATIPTNYRLGLYTYFNRYYPNQFRTVSLTGSLTYNTVISEIDDNRPGTILYWDILITVSTMLHL